MPELKPCPFCGSMTLEDYEKLNNSGNLEIIRKLCKEGMLDNE